MKINKKALELVDMGLKPDTVAKLSESQIDVLHSKLISEITMVSKTDTSTINKMKSEKKPFEVYEKEMKEQPDTEVSNMDKSAGGTTQDPVQVAGPDGMGDDGNKQIDKEKEISEKKEVKNPWAICTSQMGKEFGTSERSEWSKKQMKKYKRCVEDVKKSLKEGKDPLNLYFENRIMNIVEKHIPPRMTKGDLLKYLNEDGPAVAPSKPKEKPTTKPGKPGTKPQKPGHPLKNPNPGEKPAPKAKYEKEKKEVIDLIINLLEK
jgi:hypothetical protein